MPAIQLARLKLQVGALVDLFDQPARFRRELHDLFDYYADRTYRPGQAGQLPPLLPNYHISIPVIRQIETELMPLALANPGAALNLADELWSDTILEPRLLAVYLFSQVSPDPSDLLINRLILWARPEEDRQVLTALLSKGTARLQREQPEAWAALIKNWLGANDTTLQSYGLRAILSMINDQEFTNLPDIIRLINPLMQTVPAKLQSDLAGVVEASARRWPVETAFFLRQILSITQGSGVPRITRRCLPLFSPDIQTSLRGALQAQINRQPGPRQ